MDTLNMLVLSVQARPQFGFFFFFFSLDVIKYSQHRKGEWPRCNTPNIIPVTVLLLCILSWHIISQLYSGVTHQAQ